MTTTTAKTSDPTSEVARALASAHGLLLTPAKDGLHVLCDVKRQWCISLWPLRQHFVASASAPEIGLADGWDLWDVVEAVIRAGGTGRR